MKTPCREGFGEDVGQLPLGADMVQHDGTLRDLLAKEGDAGGYVLHPLGGGVTVS